MELGSLISEEVRKWQVSKKNLKKSISDTLMMYFFFSKSCQKTKALQKRSQAKQQRIEAMDDMDFPDTQDTIEERIAKQCDAMQIHRLLHHLEEPYKEVFMLRVFGELSFKQIADIFQKTDNWACVTYHRARNKILSQMEDKDEP